MISIDFNAEPRTVVFLSICGFANEKQRYQNLAVAFAQLGHRVFYLAPSLAVQTNVDVSEDELAQYSFQNMIVKEGVSVIQPVYSQNFKISNYNAVVRRIADVYPDAIFIISNVNEFESLIPLKGKNTIIFDCADDNSDFRNAYWSSPQLYEKERLLTHYADHVLCTSVTLFLKKVLIERIDSVLLSNNAVSYNEMCCNSDHIPDDLKNIPFPRIGYVGNVYQRFDKNLFYMLAEKNPDKSFVIVGDVLDDYILSKYKNIYLLGSKSHAELSSYYRNLDICIVPYHDNDKMSMACDPVKIHEQIICGVPTITTFMPDTAIERPLVYHANTYEGFQNLIDWILKERPSISQDSIEEYAVKNSWIARADAIIRLVFGKIHDSEKADEVVKAIQRHFFAIKDVHQNYAAVYGLSLWNDNKVEAYSYIKKANEEYPTDFDAELLEKIEEDSASISNVKHDTCTGCMVCREVCPKNAITFLDDASGFGYPVVDASLCTSCGLCREHCHVLNPQIISGGSGESQYCHMVEANDSVRMHASSGGFFPIVAMNFCSNGGWVAGAVYNNDFSVRHIVSNSPSEIRRMYESKYCESDMSGVYIKIKKLLDDGKKVLFSGVPCQCRALYSFLGRKYDSLVTIAVVCHGVPPTKFLHEHLCHITLPDENISELSFRKKSELGWNAGLYIRFNNGREYICLDDSFMDGFLSDTYLRDSCYNCNCKSDIFYDINIGDFWGIERLTRATDAKGCSYVACNTQKGVELLEENLPYFEQHYKFKKDDAIALNSYIRNSAIKPVYRRTFYANAKSSDFDAAFEKTFLDRHYDVALTLWFSNNYGNAITNYALYHILKHMGLSVIVIDNIVTRPEGRFMMFAKKYFELTSQTFPAKIKYILNCSNNFMVGSDQVFNYEFSIAVQDSGYFQLAFVPDDKNRIAYGASFGESSKAVESGKENYYRNLYQRFNSISVREKFGVDVLNDVFGVKASYVLDPVFLLDSKDYMELAVHRVKKGSRPLIVTYFLSPDEKKISFAKKIAMLYGSDFALVYIIDAEPARSDMNKKVFTSEDFVIDNITPEEFIGYFIDADYVLTDSYHGTCFSIIFEKQFLTFLNRECERFETFREFGVENRIISKTPDTVSDDMLQKVDYTLSREYLKNMRMKSYAFIKESISAQEKMI